MTLENPIHAQVPTSKLNLRHRPKEDSNDFGEPNSCSSEGEKSIISYHSFEVSNEFGEPNSCSGDKRINSYHSFEVSNEFGESNACSGEKGIILISFHIILRIIHLRIPMNNMNSNMER
jgi:hypothetical protein